MQSSDTLILGAGPAGMAAAMELSRAGKTSTLVEKSDAVGGLARTFTFKEPSGTYRTDIGPHRFFSKNKYLYDFIADLLGEDWKQVPRLTRFYVDGKYYFYPIKLSNVLLQIGFVRACRIFIDYLCERLRAFIAPRTINSFEDYAVATFGRALAEFNMLNYTEKIWGIPCTQISKDWALQRIGGLSIGTTIRKALTKRGGPKTLTDTFFYPQNGSGTIYESIAKRIEEQGSAILTKSEPTRINWSVKRVTSVEISTPSGQQSVSPKTVVSSVPVTHLVTLFHPPAPTQVIEAAKALKFRAQAYLFLIIDRDRVSADNWVYFPDKNIPFGRFAEMKNFSPKMSPAGKTSLFVEFFCFEGDRIWNMSKDELFEVAITDLERLGFVKRSEVLNVHHYKQPHVYPIYDVQYKERLEVVMHWLDSFENLYAIGRPGRFRYTNQDHSLEMGILAAQSVLDGRRRDIENVGSEKEYFERGYVPARP